MKTQYPLKNRDITWLSFNYRVLQEAKDKRNPLFERIKFLAIYSSNLGEFFSGTGCFDEEFDKAEKEVTKGVTL
jgi:polyphosphate kinase